MKRVIIIMFLMLLIPLMKVNGYYCTFGETSLYKDMAANINVSYDYVEKNNDVSFSVTLTNLRQELYIVDTTNDKKYEYELDEIVIDGYKAGQTIKYDVYAAAEYCSGTYLYSILLNLPFYNKYYKDDICVGLENYAYCKKWYNHKLSYDEFKKKVNDYKESLNPSVPEEEKEEIEESKSFLDVFLSLWLKYYYIVLPGIIVISAAAMYYNNKKSDIYK